ncbi:hypothetical protein BST61_g11563 [Cercospora zeina]
MVFRLHRTFTEYDAGFPMHFGYLSCGKIEDRFDALLQYFSTGIVPNYKFLGCGGDHHPEREQRLRRVFEVVRFAAWAVSPSRGRLDKASFDILMRFALLMQGWNMDDMEDIHERFERVHKLIADDDGTDLESESGDGPNDLESETSDGPNDIESERSDDPIDLDSHISGRDASEAETNEKSEIIEMLRELKTAFDAQLTDLCKANGDWSEAALNHIKEIAALNKKNEHWGHVTSTCVKGMEQKFDTVERSSVELTAAMLNEQSTTADKLQGAHQLELQLREEMRIMSGDRTELQVKLERLKGRLMVADTKLESTEVTLSSHEAELKLQEAEIDHLQSALVVVNATLESKTASLHCWLVLAATFGLILAMALTLAVKYRADWAGSSSSC